jgi:hypothetical protein
MSKLQVATGIVNSAFVIDKVLQNLNPSLISMPDLSKTF